MSHQFDLSTIQKALDWAYDTAVNGVPGAAFAGIGTAEELATSYLKGGGTLTNNVNALIFWHRTPAATPGFVTGAHVGSGVKGGVWGRARTAPSPAPLSAPPASPLSQHEPSLVWAESLPFL